MNTSLSFPRNRAAYPSNLPLLSPIPCLEATDIEYLRHPFYFIIWGKEGFSGGVHSSCSSLPVRRGSQTAVLVDLMGDISEIATAYDSLFFCGMQLQPCTQNWVSLGSANALKKKKILASI